MADFEEQTTSAKLGKFIENNKKCFIAVLILCICFLIGCIIFTSVADKSKIKNLNTIDEITYELTNKSSDLEDSEVEARISAALEKASVLSDKSGIAGARAAMLCAELSFRQKKYEDAVTYWKKVASKAKKTYLAPIAYFNIAASYEELGDVESAAANYKIASEDKNFAMRQHALFSYARVLETKGDFAGASAAYTELNDEYAGDSWANLAKSRLIALKNEGKIE